MTGTMKLDKNKSRDFKDEKSGCGIEVRYYEDWFDTAPQCPHGPMLLFEKFVKGKSKSRFYACAASRDRKSCNYYITERDVKKHGVKSMVGRVTQLHNDVTDSQTFCLTCQTFILGDKKSMQLHGRHKLKRNVSENDRRKPSSTLLSAVEDTKTHAQYFLSTKCTEFIHNILSTQGITHVVCIGMPRLHEHVQSMHTGRMMSILLDIDPRYEMFWTNKEFCRFNMFNRFFFNNESKSSFELFLKLAKKFENIAIVVDPPFGGLVDCVCETLKWVSNEASRLFDISPHEHQLLTTIWLFPYFMENRITNQLPLSMLDYQVAYDNHKRYKDSHQARYQSPVRIFTNIPNTCVELPAPNYRFCGVCERYVMKANKHCKICKTCPSKDGRTYKHCSVCQVCVKPGRKHCVACSRCQPPGHTCRTEWCDGCHICGKTTHKRKDCPQSVEQADGLAKMEIKLTTIEAHTSSTRDLVFKPRKRSFRNLPSHRKKLMRFL